MHVNGKDFIRAPAFLLAVSLVLASGFSCSRVCGRRPRVIHILKKIQERHLDELERTRSGK